MKIRKTWKCDHECIIHSQHGLRPRPICTRENRTNWTRRRIIDISNVKIRCVNIVYEFFFVDCSFFRCIFVIFLFCPKILQHCTHYAYRFGIISCHSIWPHPFHLTSMLLKMDLSFSNPQWYNNFQCNWILHVFTIRWHSFIMNLKSNRRPNNSIQYREEKKVKLKITIISNR